MAAAKQTIHKADLLSSTYRICYTGYVHDTLLCVLGIRYHTLLCIVWNTPGTTLATLSRKLYWLRFLHYTTLTCYIQAGRDAKETLDENAKLAQGRMLDAMVAKGLTKARHLSSPRPRPGAILRPRLILSLRHGHTSIPHPSPLSLAPVP